MIRFVCTRKSDVDEQAVVQKKKEPESLVKKDMRVVNECKCTDKKNENGDIIGKTCIKKIESNGKIAFEKCCDKNKYNEIKDENGKVKCVEKPPPKPKLTIVPVETQSENSPRMAVEPQSERPLKGKPIKIKLSPNN